MESNDKVAMACAINNAAERYELIKQVSDLTRQLGFLEGVMQTVLWMSDSEEIKTALGAAMSHYCGETEEE